MKLLRLVSESLGIAVIGALGVALVDVFNDLQAFSPYSLPWIPFVTPLVVGFAIGISRVNFKLNLFIAASVSLLSIAAYFLAYSFLNLPMIVFHGAVYPPDPARKFVLYFLADILTLVGGVVAGGFLSGE